ncbi:MAG: type II 3-dehydroquinate dehydratase [Clostridia bacterium]|nr:type II 3-dehydroquinate dehydratase [Clostridia bacterium]
MKILVINGPNLNMLGIREPDIYGSNTYSALENYIKSCASELGHEVTLFQSNHEGAIIDTIQQAYKAYDGIVINPAGYTHTSVAILDALKAVGIPTVEVHLSDISIREDFRKHSYVSLVAKKTICGLGFEGYKKALELF